MPQNDDIEPEVTGRNPRKTEQPAGEEARFVDGMPSADEDELQTLRGELEQVTDLARRSQADLENYRKRVAREFELERRYANLPLLRDLLPVIDNLERAVAAAGAAGENAGLVQGVAMILEQFRGVLAEYGCQRIEAMGQPFDPNLHQAISQQPSADHPPGSVVLETLAGYVLHDRVVRPSQVIVSTAPPEAEA